jgi:hypothetical protein
MADPAGPRASDITGDVVVNGQVMADWGLHLIDVNLAMGNLIDIVGQQSKAYLANAAVSRATFFAGFADQQVKCSTQRSGEPTAW